MRVRAVTVGWTVEWRSGRIANADECAGVARRIREVFAQSGLELQTVRLATQPFPEIVPPDAVADLARELCTLARAAEFDYVAMGPAAPHQGAWVPAMVSALVANETLFSALTVTDTDGNVSLAAVGLAGQVISELARRTERGFGNVRFAALAVCPPGIPFFPAAYHDGGALALSVAWEIADDVGVAFAGARTLAEAKQRLEERLNARAQELYAVVQSLASELGARFLGIDCSLAPFPEVERSVAGAFERLGVHPFGGPGTLAVASLVTEVLRGLPVPRTGFCGLMVPVLEDSRLAELARAGRLSLATLLAVSAVCGVGLDMVPLAGDVRPAQLSAIVLDVATLAVRLGKPLAARLMPIPGVHAGDTVQFDFPFFAPAGALPVEGEVPPDWFASDPGKSTGSSDGESGGNAEPVA